VITGQAHPPTSTWTHLGIPEFRHMQRAHAALFSQLDEGILTEAIDRRDFGQVLRVPEILRTRARTHGNSHA